MDDTVTRRFEELKAAGILPSPRGVALAIMDLALRPDTAIEHMARLIQTDPAMTGRVLRYANAIGSGNTRPIASIGRAVTILGMFRVRQIVVGFSLIDEYRSGHCRAFDYERYWSTSLATAIAAQRLAGVAQSPPGESFTCGLLAGVGRLALATVFPEEYGLILETRPAPQALIDAEIARFGIDHGQLSAEMLSSWGLPEIFIDAVRHHETLSQPSEPDSRSYALTSALHLAMRIGQLLMLDDAGRWEQLPSLYNAAGQAGLNQDDIRPLVEEVAADWHAWTAELSLPSRSHRSLEELFDAPPAARAENGRKPPTPPIRVAAVVNDRRRRETLSHALESLGFPHQFHGAIEALTTTMGPDRKPDLVLLDLAAAAPDAESQQRHVMDLALAGMNVVLLIPAAAEMDFPQFLEMGAMDYLVDGFTEAAAIARLRNAQRLISLQGAIRAEREQAINASRQWARANRRLLYDALTDPLTQLPNRRYGLDRLGQEWSIATSNGLPIACLMMDVDHFKQVNDRHGHGVGDLVLRQFADAVQRCCRRSDVVFRYGGEEFCCICPATGAAEAHHLAGRIMEAVRTTEFGSPDAAFHLTLSIGLALRSPGMSEPPELVAAADKALYLAKERGRDRMVAL